MTRAAEWRAAIHTRQQVRVCPQMRHQYAASRGVLAPEQAIITGQPWLVRDEHTDTSTERVIVGHASVVGVAYEVWDAYGAYQETIAPGAFAATLSRGPEVAHRIEHQGLGLSSTRSGSLTLTEDSIGLRFRSRVDTRESDARDLVSKLSRGVAGHTSFAFRIVGYEWSLDHSELTITEIDLDAGDVASCCYGANPHGSHQVLTADQAALTADTPPPADNQPSQPTTEALRLASQLDDHIARLRYPDLAGHH